jgi:hypothetical protein
LESALGCTCKRGHEGANYDPQTGSDFGHLVAPEGLLQAV